MRDDVKYAVRRLLAQPGLTIVAVLTLVFGLGANTAIFSLLHAVMFQSLPVPRPAELYRLGNDATCCVNSGLQRHYSLFSTSAATFLREQLTEFRDLAAFQANTTVTAVRPAADAPRSAAFSAPATFVSGNYFRMLGVSAAYGRALEPRDDDPSAPTAGVLSYRQWSETFGADPSIVGRAVFIGGEAVTIVGVMPAAFFGETTRANPAGLWLPLGQETRLRGATAISARPESDWLYLMGRLPDGARVDSVQAKATIAMRAWLAAQTFWSEDDRRDLATSDIIVAATPGGVQALRNNFGQPLTMLLAMSALVLLIAAANLANLLLARADRTSASIRAALGASAGALARQSIVEGLLLALAGCAGALVLSSFATRAIVSLAFPPEARLPLSLAPSPMMVLFSIGLALVTGLVFAAAPAWAMGRTDPMRALRGVAREGADVAFMPRRSLVIVQVTLSLVLLAGAGLLGRSLRALETQPLNFEPERRVVVSVDPPPLANAPDRLAEVYAAMQANLQRIPGVARASYAMYSPMEGNNWSGPIAIGGRPQDPARPTGSSWNRVGPDYFETVGTRILRGRGITAADRPTSEHVAVVSQAFANLYFPGEDPIGHTIGQFDASRAFDYKIVGVAADVKYSGASRDVRPMVFFPALQLAPLDDPSAAQTQARSTLMRSIVLELAPGTTGIEPQVRAALISAHPDMVATRLTTMERQVAGNFRTNRLLAALTSAYGVLALALASLGLYGVTSYGVSRRAHEIGVRMALGAAPGQIVWEIMRSALTQSAMGLAIGLPAALLTAGLIASQLYNVPARDPWVFGAATIVLLFTAAAASALPARRAAAVDPTKALRG
jgi:predicted permease